MLRRCTTDTTDAFTVYDVSKAERNISNEIIKKRTNVWCTLSRDNDSSSSFAFFLSLRRALRARLSRKLLSVPIFRGNKLFRSFRIPSTTPCSTDWCFSCVFKQSLNNHSLKSKYHVNKNISVPLLKLYSITYTIHQNLMHKSNNIQIEGQ